MRKTIILFFTLFFLFSCSKENESDILDRQLSTALIEVSNGLGEGVFILPNENDLNHIPQDPLNPLSSEKVLLGKLLFHETGIALVPMKDFSKGTYSCASCHFAGRA